MLKRIGLLLVLFVLPAAGCTMCASHNDYCGPVQSGCDSCDFFARRNSVLGGDSMAGGETIMAEPEYETEYEPAMRPVPDRQVRRSGSRKTPAQFAR